MESPVTRVLDDRMEEPGRKSKIRLDPLILIVRAFVRGDAVLSVLHEGTDVPFV